MRSFYETKIGMAVDDKIFSTLIWFDEKSIPAIEVFFQKRGFMTGMIKTFLENVAGLTLFGLICKIILLPLLLKLVEAVFGPLMDANLHARIYTLSAGIILTVFIYAKQAYAECEKHGLKWAMGWNIGYMLGVIPFLLIIAGKPLTAFYFPPMLMGGFVAIGIAKLNKAAP